MLFVRLLAQRRRHASTRAERRKWGSGVREKSKFKVRKKEHSSSVVQTQCIISHSRCVDYLFNWIMVWDCKRQRPIVVGVERGGWAEEGRWVTILHAYRNTNPVTTGRCVFNASLTLVYTLKHIQVYEDQWGGGLFVYPLLPRHLTTGC